MKAEEAHLYLPLIKAWSEGKILEYKLFEKGEWFPLPKGAGLSFTNPPTFYRIQKVNMYSVALFKDSENKIWITSISNIFDEESYKTLKEAYETNSHFIKWLDKDKPIGI
jgi:hypothetical protein